MLLLEFLKQLVFFEFFKKMLAGMTDNVDCDELDGAQCTICKVHKGVASRIVRLNNEGILQNSQVMLIGGILMSVVLFGLGTCFLIGKFSEKVKQAYLFLKRKVIWNSVIRYFLQSTLKLQITVAADLYFIM